MNDRKKAAISIIGVILLIIGVLGISYAAFNYSKTGQTVNSITTSKIMMNYTEKENGITLVDALPMKDETGKNLTGNNNVFDFTISANITGGNSINYAITGSKVEGTTLPDSAVKVWLTSNEDTKAELNGVSSLTDPAKKISELSLTKDDASGAIDGEYLLKNGVITETGITNYRLRMWIAEDYEVNHEKVETYKLRVNAYGREGNYKVEDEFEVENNSITLDLNEKKEEQIKLNKELENVSYQKGSDIIDVSEDGNITAKSLGETEVTVQNGTVSKKVTVKVVKTVTATYTKQGSGVLSIDKESDTCVLEKEEDSCSKELPNIVVDTGYTSLGWSMEKTAKEGATGTISFKDNVEYYTISYKDEISYKVFFNKNGNTISEEEKSCIIEKAYNGESQKTSCEVTTPTIEENPNTPMIIGYSTKTEDHTKIVGSEESLTVDASNNGTTYYAQTKSEEKEYNVNYSMQGTGVTAIGKESDSCTINETYNGEEQDTSCTVDAPDITVLEGYTKVGWSENKQAESGIAVGAKITLSKEEAPTYYSISYKNAITYQVSFNENGNVIDATEKTCVLPAAYNTTEQQTSCNIETPTISINPNTPTIIGYSTKTDDHTKTVGSKESLTINETNNGTTYYAQTTKEKVDYTVKFDANNNIIDDTEKSCSLAATFNGVEQETTCTVMTPTITAPANTQVIVGYHQDKASHIAEVGSNQELIVSAENHNKTYYAITKSEAITRNVNYSMQGLGVTAIGKESDNCTIGETYNNEKQDTFCTVDAPDITVLEGYTKVGWNENKEETTGVAVGANITLSTEDAPIYYSISYKNEVTYKVNFNENGNTIDTTEKTCTIEKSYNTTPQATSCDITTPTITANSNTPDIIGYNQEKDTHTLQVGSNAKLSVDANINGKTYYAQTTAPAKKHTITFNKNGAQSQTDEGNVAQTTETVTRSCTREATFNGEAQAAICSVTSPTIVGTDITPTVTGYSDAAENHSSGWSHNSPKEISGDAIWYAQTTRGAVTKNVTYKTTTGVSTVGKESDSCTIAAIYNNNGGNSQATSCTVQAPTINVSSGYEVIGWNTSNVATTGVAAGTNLTLTDASTTYYALAKIILPNAIDKLLSSYTNSESLKDYQSSTTTQKKNMYVFTHTAGVQQSGWSSSELKDYRYIGDDPNNYVSFNGGTADWRIIGIETVENEKGVKEQRIKIMQKTALNPYPRWDSRDVGTYKIGSNDWTKSQLMQLLNEGYSGQTGGSIYWNRTSGTCYASNSSSFATAITNGTYDCDYRTQGLTSDAKNLIGSTKWYLGASETDDTTSTGENYYGYERSNASYGSQSTSWVGKVGLIYPSDYLYTFANGVNNSCYSSKCDSTTIKNSWIGKLATDNMATITSYMERDYTVYAITSNLGIRPVVQVACTEGDHDCFIRSVRYGYLVYPVVYLKADTLYQSGDGSQSNPFVFKSPTSSDQGIEGPSSIRITSQKEVLTSPTKVCQEEVSTGSSYNFDIDSNAEVKTGSICTTSNNTMICTDYNNDIDTTSNKSCMNGNNVITYTKNSDSCGYIYVCDDNNKCSAKREC